MFFLCRAFTKTRKNLTEYVQSAWILIQRPGKRFGYKTSNSFVLRTRLIFWPCTKGRFFLREVQNQTSTIWFYLLEVKGQVSMAKAAAWILGKVYCALHRIRSQGFHSFSFAWLQYWLSFGTSGKPHHCWSICHKVYSEVISNWATNK